MKIKIVYTKKSVKDLQKLGRAVAQKIIKKIKYYTKQKDLFSFAKKLNPPFDDLYRFRIGEYRAVFEIDKTNKLILLLILKVDHRKNIYF
jgi:mRNA-degrading endonuclease RelE of RelBE toxin-antitoxin system